MAFPATPLPVTVECEINNTWTNVTSDVRASSGIDIDNRGRRNEQANAFPTSCRLTLDNRTGKYSNRNPLSPYYGLLPRNTPLRVSVPTTSGNWAFLSGDQSGNRIETADKAALDITGDIDIRIDFELTDWYPSQFVVLASKYDDTGNQISWVLYMNGRGNLTLAWSTDGTFANLKTATATARIPKTGRFTVRATLDVDNGAAGRTTNFYTSTSVSGTWTALGSAVTTAGTTNIFSSSADLVIGAADAGDIPFNSTFYLAARVYRFQLLSGIAGTVKADVDFSTWGVDDTSKADGFGNTWTMVGARVQTDSIRFCGEVSAWPPKWDYSGKNIYVPIEASGILRRLGQGASPIRSPIYRNFLKYVPNAYWTLEDGSAATQAASAVPLGKPARVVDVTFADDDTLPGSDAVLKLNSTTSQVLGAANESVATGEASLVCYAKLATAPPSKTQIVTFYSTGTIKRWVISLSSTTIYLDGYDENNLNIVGTNLGLGDLVVTEWMAFYISVIDSGVNTNWVSNFHKVGSNTIYTFGTNLLTNATAGYFTRFDITSSGYLVDAHFAHIFFSLEEVKFVTSDLRDSSNGYIGEAAATRIARLCAEEDIPIDVVGFAPDCAAMGRQRTEKLVDLINAAVEADMGILYEPRDILGLGYRTRKSIYRQSGTGLTLNYSASQLSGSFEPVEDDQSIRNDVSVRREGGSSVRAVLATGALSVQPPPNGVGRYDEAVTVDVELDAQLKNVADWRVSLGTVDVLRFPTLEVNLARTEFTSNATLTAQAIGVDVGDYLAVTNLPNWLPQMTVETIAQGMAESLGQFEWRITWNATPANLYAIGTWDETSRYDTENSTTAASFTSGTSTSLSVSTAAGASLWVTGSGAPQFPFDIEVAGVRLTVTAISGTSSPQTSTITATPVNGVVKVIPVGSQVKLWTPSRYGY